MPRSTSVSATILVLFLGTSCGTALPPVDLDVSPAAGKGAPSFVDFFEPSPADIKAAMPSYQLPLQAGLVSNAKQIEGLYLKDPAVRELLVANGFVVIDGGTVDDIAEPYRRLQKQDIPIYVTADTLLHLFHIQFDETLKAIEEKAFYPDILETTRVLLAASERDYESLKGDLREAAERNVAYFSVALRQLDPDSKTPGYVKDVVDWECKRISAHKGLPRFAEARESSLFRLPEDYSQYKPRGHYTRSETLKRYFKGMIWFGRMTFLMKGHDKFGQFVPPAKALTDRVTARIQTMQAALIASRVGQLKLADGRRLTEAWDRIYSVTAFYAGFSDDLTLYDYREALRSVFGSKFPADDLEDKARWRRLLLELSRMRKPAIFSGTGGAGVDPGEAADHVNVSVEQLDKILDHTQGFRFMGQRYIPDSFILGQMVSPAVGTIPRRAPEHFTTGYIPDERIQPDLVYTIRAFPRGLDVFSVLGSKRAEAILAAEGDDAYPLYGKQTVALRERFQDLSQKDWNRNLYWSWLYALKTLVRPGGEGYQAFQQSDAWTDRKLAGALASWASLRHDTILYAKQSYTPMFMTTEAAPPGPPPPPPPKGLVEPEPLFFMRLLATAKMAKKGLSDMKVLDGKSESRLSALVATLEYLTDLCQRQVANEPLTAADNAFLAAFPDALKGAIGDVDDKGLRTTLIADVHTDLNSKQSLEEGSGYVDLVVVAYKRPEGDIVLAVGPVLSYYEFKQPMKERLTDEEWRSRLAGDDPPSRPRWNGSYTRLLH